MDNDFLTQSGLPELSLSGVRTCGLNSISCAFPHRKLTVVAGPPGAGKTALVVYTAYAEARRRLALGLGEDRVWPLRYYPAAEFDAVNGLLPAVNISDLAGEAQGSGPVLSLLGLDGMLSSVLYHYGNLHCARDGAVIEDASAAQVFCQVSEFAKTESASGKDAARGGTLNLLAEAVIYEAAGVNPEAPTLETLVQQVVTFQKRGYRRFVINASLYTLPPFGDPALRGEAAQAVDEARKNFIDAISSAGSISYFAVVVDSIVFRVQEKERFLDAVYAAQAAGEGIAVLRPALRTSAAQSAAALDLSPICWRSFAGCCCPECGQRFSQSVSVLQREVRAGVLARRPGKKRHVELRLFKKNLAEILAEPLSSLHELVESGQRGRGDASDTPAAACAARLTAALSSLCRLGLDHLALSLPAKTLSSGERLRVQTARFLLAQVAETLFVLDEPSRVLHQADLHLLSAALRELVDRGNTVVVAEQSGLAGIASADWLIELGASPDGKRSVCFSGNAASWPRPDTAADTEVLCKRKLKPAKRLMHGLCISLDASRFPEQKIKLPLRSVVAVCGRSGAGKTRLLSETLLGGFRRYQQGREAALKSGGAGWGSIRRAVYLGQISFSRRRLQRTKLVWDTCRLNERIAQFFSELPAARKNGYTREMFLLGGGGSCRACAGSGVIETEFDVGGSAGEQCAVCHGRRYAPELDAVNYKEASISDVLESEVKTALQLFSARLEILQILLVFDALGLSGLRLGERASRLAQSVQQRLELARLFVSCRPNGVLYLLDQPLAGLSRADVEVCMPQLHKIARQGGSIFFSTHDHFAAALSDFVVELGEGGEVELRSA